MSGKISTHGTEQLTYDVRAIVSAKVTLDCCSCFPDGVGEDDDDDNIWADFDSKVASRSSAVTPTSTGTLIIEQRIEMPYVKRKMDYLSLKRLAKLYLRTFIGFLLHIRAFQHHLFLLKEYFHWQIWSQMTREID